MIEQHRVELLDNRQVFDADMDSDGAWVAVVGSDADTADATIYLGTEIRLNRRFRFPIVRIIDHQRFLVVDARCASDDRNAAIVTVDKPWRPLSFHAGDGVEDVLVTTDFIACTYFDEGVFGDTPISAEGVAIFDFAGEFRFGYQSRLTAAAVDVADCYAARNVNGDEIAFCPYTGFPVVNWNLKTGSHATVRLPAELHGPSAMSSFRGGYFFHSPYKSPEGLFYFKDGSSRQVAMQSGRLKPLRDGRFLRTEADGCSVLDYRSAV